MAEHVYFPGPDPEWEQIPPESAGFDDRRLCSAVDEIRKAETSAGSGRITLTKRAGAFWKRYASPEYVRLSSKHRGLEITRRLV